MEERGVVLVNSSVSKSTATSFWFVLYETKFANACSEPHRHSSTLRGTYQAASRVGRAHYSFLLRSAVVRVLGSHTVRVQVGDFSRVTEQLGSEHNLASVFVRTPQTLSKHLQKSSTNPHELSITFIK